MCISDTFACFGRIYVHSAISLTQKNSPIFEIKNALQMQSVEIFFIKKILLLILSSPGFVTFFVRNTSIISSWYRNVTESLSRTYFRCKITPQR
jgi:hypothetical protein